MVTTFGNDIVDAYTNGVQVKFIYSRGVRVWPAIPSPSGNNVIYYTTKDGNPLTFSSSPATSAAGSIVSNVYDSTMGVYVLTFQNSVTQIDTSGFEYMTQLETVILPSSVHTINPYAFKGSGLVSIDMPGVDVLSLRAFEDCIYLRQVTIPATCTQMALGVFKNCTILSTVVVLATTPPWMAREDGGGYTQFSGTSQALVILVPGSSLNDYLEADGWSSYSNKITSL